MRNKGFTLVELILVIVIIGIIAAITIPGIMDAMKESKETGGETIEKLLKTNLELYNTDNEKDLWCLENSTCTDAAKRAECNTVTIENLYDINPDIDMGDCVLENENSLVVARKENGYAYYANIVCSKNFSSASYKNKILVLSDRNAQDVYYKTATKYRCDNNGKLVSYK